MLVGGCMLATGAPAAGQSSSLLASAVGVATVAEVEQQDDTIIRRRRSGSVAWVGGIMAVAGTVLALGPPRCTLVGAPNLEGPRFPVLAVEFTAQVRNRRCDLRLVGETGWVDPDGSLHVFETVIYKSDSSLYFGEPFFFGRDVETDRTANYAGWATAIVGGALLWFGLSEVEVPFRVDVTPGGGVGAWHAIEW